MRRSIVALSIFSASGLASPITGLLERQAALPASWKPGVRWQIVEQAPVDVSQPLSPIEAQVWDIDLFQAQDHPEIIPFLVSDRYTSPYNRHLPMI